MRDLSCWYGFQLIQSVSFIFINHHINITKKEDGVFLLFILKHLYNISSVYIHEKERSHLWWNCETAVNFKFKCHTLCHGNPKHQYRLRDKGIENNHTEIGLEVELDEKRWQGILAAQKPNHIMDHMKKKCDKM